MKTEINIKKIILIVSSILVVAVLGSIFVNLGMDWYATLDRPSSWVPDILIPIMWSIIYLAFAIILSIWATKSTIDKEIMVWLIINAVLNILWCLLFFTFNLLLIGNICIILLLISSIMLITKIISRNNLYGYILSIYPIWVSIATTLNTALWILN